MSWINKSPPKKRVNWKEELKRERGRVLQEAIDRIKADRRTKPIEWHRGYNSAITELEKLKDANR